MGIRAEIVEDMEEMIADPDDFGLPIQLTDPNGVIYDKSALDATKALMGLIHYDRLIQDENDNTVADNQPIVTIRRVDLERIPLAGEKWKVAIPISPLPGADMVTHMLAKAPADGQSVGYIRLFLRKVEQS